MRRRRRGRVRRCAPLQAPGQVCHRRRRVQAWAALLVKLQAPARGYRRCKRVLVQGFAFLPGQGLVTRRARLDRDRVSDFQLVTARALLRSKPGPGLEFVRLSALARGHHQRRLARGLHHPYRRAPGPARHHRRQVQARAFVPQLGLALALLITRSARGRGFALRSEPALDRHQYRREMVPGMLSAGRLSRAQAAGLRRRRLDQARVLGLPSGLAWVSSQARQARAWPCVLSKARAADRLKVNRVLGLPCASLPGLARARHRRKLA